MTTKLITADKVGRISLQNNDIDWAIRHINERTSLAAVNGKCSIEIGLVCEREKFKRIVKELLMNGYYVKVIDMVTENAMLCEISWRACDG